MIQLIAGNWKMHKRPSEVAAWMAALKQAIPAEGVEVAICAPFTHLCALQQACAGSAIAYGAQDVSAHASGAYTGEVAAAMLADLGCRYVIVGHSERRSYHREDDALINRKLHQALAHQLRPILCVGERADERAAGEAEAVVLRQLAGALEGIDVSDPRQLAVAYEPVWAIGTGNTATAADAQAMSALIRAALAERYPELAAQLRILYGGSMKPENAAEILAQPDVNGGLIGGASLEVADFAAIVKAAHHA